MTLTISLFIIVITVVISINAFNNSRVMNNMLFYPPAVANQNQWYRLFTHGFVHADWSHLIFNMLTLYFFGAFVETGFSYIFGVMGRLVYLLFYLSAIAVAVVPTYMKEKENYYYRCLGASGAVTAVLFAGLIFDPIKEVSLFFIPIPIRGFIFAPLYILLSVIMEKRNAGNINHMAHITGAIYGVLFVVVCGKLFAGINFISYCLQVIREYFN